MKIIGLSLLLYSQLSFADFQEDALWLCQHSETLMQRPFDLNDILHELYAKFDEKDDRGYKIEFRAEKIELENDEVVFEDPRIEGKVIDDQESWCSEVKKNFLGYEVCRQISKKDSSDSLCKKLGHVGAVYKENEVRLEKTSNTWEGMAYMLESDKWVRLNLWSYLSPRIYYTRIKKLRCKLK